MGDSTRIVSEIQNLEGYSFRKEGNAQEFFIESGNLRMFS